MDNDAQRQKVIDEAEEIFKKGEGVVILYEEEENKEKGVQKEEKEPIVQRPIKQERRSRFQEGKQYHCEIC